ncbi:MAG: class I SAM-dependent methyltransferase [Candidatus Eremiobacteraeota bacterium]|nr:class I SAM-dependent methyltransferase [Candidatus Eremiobacteraeota bacterium]
MRSVDRFGSRAEVYAEFRPSYPSEALDAVLDGLGDPAALSVADVGAGTGISAHLFAERGARVIAIEPNAAMRAAARPHPRVTWRDATAEITGLPDASVDLVVACQAFHWFATAATMREFRRIARRRAALLQYERDERDAFTQAYGEIVRTYATDDTELLRAAALDVFRGFPGARAGASTALSKQSLNREELLGRIASASYLPNEGAAAAALREEMEALFERHRDGDRVELKMVTHVLRADW